MKRRFPLGLLAQPNPHRLPTNRKGCINGAKKLKVTFWRFCQVHVSVLLNSSLKLTADEKLFLELALRGYDVSELRENEATTAEIIKIDKNPYNATSRRAGNVVERTEPARPVQETSMDKKKSKTLTQRRRRSSIKSRILFMTHPGGSIILAGYVIRKVGNAMNAVSS